MAFGWVNSRADAGPSLRTVPSESETSPQASGVLSPCHVGQRHQLLRATKLPCVMEESVCSLGATCSSPSKTKRVVSAAEDRSLRKIGWPGHHDHRLVKVSPSPFLQSRMAAKVACDASAANQLSWAGPAVLGCCRRDGNLKSDEAEATRRVGSVPGDRADADFGVAERAPPESPDRGGRPP
jgi:hypothetical protein